MTEDEGPVVTLPVGESLEEVPVVTSPVGESQKEVVPRAEIAGRGASTDDDTPEDIPVEEITIKEGEPDLSELVVCL